MWQPAYTTQTRCCHKRQTSPSGSAVWRTGQNIPLCSFSKTLRVSAFFRSVHQSLVITLSITWSLSFSLSSAMSVFWISSLLIMSNNTPYGKRHGKRHGISYTHLWSWKASRKSTRNGLYTLSVLEKRLRK